MPRLTYQPSGMSRASRSAICTRVIALQGGSVLTFSLTSALTISSLRHRRLTVRHVQHAVDVNPRRRNFFRIERAEFDDVLSLHDRQLRGRRHHRIEIARGRPVGEVAPAVGFPRLDQRHVAGQRVFQNVFAAANLPLFLAFGELGADGRRRVEGRNAGPGRAHALRHRALRHDFKLDAAFAPERFEHNRIGGARERAHDLSHVAGFQKLRQPQMPDARIVGDNRQILGPLLDQTIDQHVRLADAAEAADEHDGAIGHPRHRLGHGSYDFVDHRTGCINRSSPRKRGPRKSSTSLASRWIPAFAGMSGIVYPTTRILRPSAKAGITSRANRARLSCASPPPPPLSNTYSTPSPRSFSSLRAISSG